MSLPVNAETAAKINAMEHVAELYKQADSQKQGFVLAYMGHPRKNAAGRSPAEVRITHDRKEHT